MHALEAKHCTAYVIRNHFVAFLYERSEGCDEIAYVSRIRLHTSHPFRGENYKRRRKGGGDENKENENKRKTRLGGRYDTIRLDKIR